MSWAPSSETLLVLKQVGYSRKLLETAITEYQKNISRFSISSLNADNEFFSFLRRNWPRESNEVDARHRSVSGFLLTKAQLKELIGLGYWLEVVDNQLAHFVLDENQHNPIIVSRYGLFKDYLKRRVPLGNLSPESWYPTKALVGTIFTELLVNEKDFDLFFDNFLEAVERRDVATHLLPRFFFNFVKKNQKKIRELGAVRYRRDS